MTVRIATAGVLAGLGCLLAAPPPAAGRADPGAKPLSRQEPPAMRWPDLFARPKPAPSARVPYGPLPQEFGELWIPKGPPRAAVVMIHGGCWTKSVADLSIMNYAADDFRRRGFLVWNVEYRGADEAGGGYPGAYLDVGAALDALPALAKSHGLPVRKILVLGHSAGGHLALWSAARTRLPAASALRSQGALRPDGVVDLAGIADLRRDLDTACGPEVVRALAGPAGPDRPDPYADTSPTQLLPNGIPTIVIHGIADKTVPPRVGEAYAAKAKALGDPVAMRTPPGGHVEIIAPGTAAFTAVVEAVEELVRP